MKKKLVKIFVISGIVISCLLMAIVNLYCVHVQLKPYLYAHPTIFKPGSVEFSTWVLFGFVQLLLSVCIGAIGRKILIKFKIITLKKDPVIPDSKFEGMFPGFHDC